MSIDCIFLERGVDFTPHSGNLHKVGSFAKGSFNHNSTFEAPPELTEFSTCVKNRSNSDFRDVSIPKSPLGTALSICMNSDPDPALSVFQGLLGYSQRDIQARHSFSEGILSFTTMITEALLVQNQALHSAMKRSLSMTISEMMKFSWR
jgi:hypothetical protein